MSTENELKIGDTLFCKSYYSGLSKSKIIRFTPTTIVLDGCGDSKIRKPFKEGSTLIGSGGYNNTRYYTPTQELEDEYTRNQNIKKIGAFSWIKASNKKIQEVVDLLSLPG